mmetsp:Transcript_121519/g.170973  ORF Transcript_121519/g.170973 Transcript_121519/m.170973 type:complete len:153 (+) Transcript_121519:395-853(+)
MTLATRNPCLLIKFKLSKMPGKLDELHSRRLMQRSPKSQKVEVVVVVTNEVVAVTKDVPVVAVVVADVVVEAVVVAEAPVDVEVHVEVVVVAVPVEVAMVEDMVVATMTAMVAAMVVVVTATMMVMVHHHVVDEVEDVDVEDEVVAGVVAIR